MKSAWTLEDLYRSIARGWRLLLAFTVVFAVLGLAAFFAWPQKFQATAVMTVEPLTVSASQGSNVSVNMETERVVATSSEVLLLAAKELGSPSITALSEAVDVSVPKGSQVLEFSVTADAPVTAAKWANAIANAYSERRIANAEAVVADAITFLSGKIAELETQAAAANLAGENLQSLQAQIASLQTNQASLTSTTFYSGALISPAVDPPSSTRPSLAVFLAGGLFIGLFLGSFAALVFGRRQLQLESAEATASAGVDAAPQPVNGQPWSPRRLAKSSTAPRTASAWLFPKARVGEGPEPQPVADRDDLVVPGSASSH
ncbi:MAG: Wzz/FepE/Etk N-terminal domain-containing protein [Mycetocola sp.]